MALRGVETLHKRGVVTPGSSLQRRPVTWVTSSSRSSAARRAEEDLAMLQELELKVQQTSQRQNRPSQLNGGLAAIWRQLMKDGVVGVEDAAATSSQDKPAPSLAEIAAAIEETNAEASRLEALCSARDAAIAARDEHQEAEEEWQREQDRQRLLGAAAAAVSSRDIEKAAAPVGPAGGVTPAAAAAEALHQGPEQVEHVMPAARGALASQHSDASAPGSATESAQAAPPPAAPCEAAQEPASRVQADEPPAEQAVAPTVKVAVAVQCWTRPGEDLVLAGSIPLLGNWQLPHALPLHWTTGGWWRAEFDVPADAARVEYKAILLVGNRIIWEAGPNKVLQVLDGPEASCSHVFSA